MLWQPSSWSSHIISVISRRSTSRPIPRCEMSQFWQNTQRRLHQEKKIVPEHRPAAQRIPLAVVAAITRDHGALAGAASRIFHALAPVRVAVARAQIAFLKVAVSRLDMLREFAASGESEISGTPNDDLRIISSWRAPVLTLIGTESLTMRSSKTCLAACGEALDHGD